MDKELRQAKIRYRTLFDELVEDDGAERHERQEAATKSRRSEGRNRTQVAKIRFGAKSDTGRSKNGRISKKLSVSAEGPGMLEATDRELHIVKKALALAITALNGVADHHRTAASEGADMKAMLDHLCPDEFELEMVVRNAGWVLNGTDPLPPEQMRQLRALDDDPDSTNGNSSSEE